MFKKAVLRLNIKFVQRYDYVNYTATTSTTNTIIAENLIYLNRQYVIPILKLVMY